MAARSDSNHYICLFCKQTHAWCLAEVMGTGSLVVVSTGGLEGGFREKDY